MRRFGRRHGDGYKNPAFWENGAIFVPRKPIFPARTGYIQGHDCLFADKKKTVPLRDIVFPEKMSGKEPRHTAADNQHIRAHIPPEPRKGGRRPLPPCLVQD